MTMLEATLVAEDYESRVRRGELKGDALRAALASCRQLTAVRKRRPPMTIAAVPEWAQETVLFVCSRYRVTVDALIGDQRHAAIVAARHEAAWRLRQLSGPSGAQRSTVEIGRALGGRDHSTIIYALAKYEAELSPTTTVAA